MNQADTSEDTQQPDDPAAAPRKRGDGDRDDDRSATPVGSRCRGTDAADEAERQRTRSLRRTLACRLPATAKQTAKPAVEVEDEPRMDWYILKVAFNREDSIADALRKRVKMEGMAEFFGDIVVPTEDVATFTRDGKRRITKRKLLPGYIMVNMIINDDTWFLVRETNGISDFTGAAGKPMPMEPSDIERFITRPQEDEEEEAPIKIGIPFKVGDRVRVKEGNFENQEGDVDSVDEANGRVTVIINIFGRSVPMELDHWQVEPL